MKNLYLIKCQNKSKEFKIWIVKKHMTN
jgi:hypothetical protein